MVFVGYRCPRQVMVCVLPTKPGSHRLADRDFISKERQDEIKRSLSKDYRWHFPPRNQARIGRALEAGLSAFDSWCRVICDET